MTKQHPAPWRFVPYGDEAWGNVLDANGDHVISGVTSEVGPLMAEAWRLPDTLPTQAPGLPPESDAATLLDALRVAAQARQDAEDYSCRLVIERRTAEFDEESIFAPSRRIREILARLKEGGK